MSVRASISLLFCALVSVAFATSADAKLKGLSGDITVFRCDMMGSGISVGTRVEPALIVSMNTEVTTGQSVLITKRSDFVSFTDRRKVFGKAQNFTLSGQWPGKLALSGSSKAGTEADLELSPSDKLVYESMIGWKPAYNPDFPKLASISLKTKDGTTTGGTCVVAYLTPVRN